MADVGPTLDYAKPPQRALMPWQSIAALPPLFFAPMTMCMCGYMDWVSFPFTATAAWLSWWGFARKDRPSAWRLIVVMVVVLASLAVMKNVADILWLGHNPLLRRGSAA